MNYKVPNSGVILEMGHRVAIPVYGFHHDLEYYPDPEVFNPDRFTPEQSANPTSRNCIGLRFGMLQTKVGLAYLLQKFRFKPTARTPSPLKIAPSNVIMSPEGGGTVVEGGEGQVNKRIS